MFDLLFDLFDADVPDVDVEPDIPDDYSCNDMPGVEEGVFFGDDEDLNELAEAGEVEDSTHIDSDDIVRDLAARSEFLSSIGYEELPEGYEVHHIIPLSEGGSDTPDNMVLIYEEDHDKITDMHRDFYKW